MKKLLACILSSVCALTLAAQDKALLETLVKKGMLTRQEATQIAKESVAVKPAAKETKSIKVFGGIQGRFKWANNSISEGAGSMDQISGFELRYVKVGLFADVGHGWTATLVMDFGSDGDKHRPIMLHRVIFGSIERFIGILTEHYAGRFPVWLAPVQVRVLSVSEKSFDYASQVAAKLKSSGIRMELDNSDNKIGYKIREAQLQKVPYMLVLGEKESDDGTIVTVRTREGQDLGSMPLDDFIAKVQKETAERSS